MQLQDTKQNIKSGNFKVVRREHLCDKVVIINGQPGCGKTMLSPIISALERVELLTYAYELEHICALSFFGKIDFDAAVAMARMFTDLQLYNTMMCREINFRPSDLSSIFHDAHPGRYLGRLFQKGDKTVPQRIKKERPILNLTTHNLLPISEPLFAGLGGRFVLIELVRHPLYMLKQQTLNMEHLFTGTTRDFTIYFGYKEHQLPFFVQTWEDLFIRSNPTEKAIYSIQKLSKLAEEKANFFKENYKANIITIPFEKFVIDPWPYMKKIEEKIDSKVNRATRKMMKKQNIPRKMYAEGIGLKIYKRCGWQPPKSSNENHEFEIRRRFAEKQASKEAIQVLDKICAEYEEKYLGGRKKTSEHYE